MLYRILMFCGSGLEIIPRLAKRDWTALEQRLGRTVPSSDTPQLWLHAASNGEVASAKPVIERLIAEGYHLLVTTNTDSAVSLVRSWQMAGVSAQLAPVDLSGPTRRIIRNWRITAHITFESELWPQRILACPGQVLVLGGRLTARSARGWRRFEALARRVVARVDYLSAQDAASLEHFRSFGLREDATGPVFDLKALYVPNSATPDATLTAAFDRRNTWLAASTHEGEDEIILNAHRKAKETRDDLHLILAPRHPKRAKSIADLAAHLGMSASLRSENALPRDTDVYIADTLGEMHLWYALAGTTFVAGSLTDRGGHTPYEPAHFGSAILHGPDTSNFKAAYERLAQADAATEVSTADDLAQALIALADPEMQAARGQAAKAALGQTTDVDTLMRDVIAVLNG